MADFSLKKNDLFPHLAATLENADGTAIDITGASVLFRMRKRGETTNKISAAASVVTADAGEVEYAWTDGDTDTAGSYEAEWVITFPGGQQIVPNGRMLVIEILESLA